MRNVADDLGAARLIAAATVGADLPAPWDAQRFVLVQDRAGVTPLCDDIVADEDKFIRRHHSATVVATNKHRVAVEASEEIRGSNRHVLRPYHRNRALLLQPPISAGWESV